MDDRLKDASEQRDIMLKLQATAGWKYLCELLDSTAEQELNNTILNACPGIDAVLIQEFTKGKIAAFRHIKNIPGSVIDASNAVIDSFKNNPSTEENRDAA
jgi:hypothetical protein